MMKILRPSHADEPIVPFPFLGDEDASVEWERAEKPIDLFYDTKSYETFKRHDILYLYGRRGSGKTFFIRMLDHETNTNSLSEYTMSSVLNHEDAYAELAIQLRGSPFADLQQSELVYILGKKWRWVLLASAMKEVLRRHDNSDSHKNEVKTIRDYLVSEGIVEQDPLARIGEIFINELMNIGYESAKLGMAVSKILNALKTPEFNHAENALIKIINDKDEKCLVMVDAVETYNVSDNISQAVITALIDAVYDLYLHSESSNIYAKAAFPSELYPQFSIVNKGKKEAKSIFILWQYKDLVCLLAKRYHSKLTKTDNVKDGDLDKYKTAKEYLNKYINPIIASRNNIQFDALGYIFKHTQKKPRQIITLMNIILTYAKEREGDHLCLKRRSITEGVHARLDMLVTGSLDIYGRIYPNGDNIIKSVLSGAKNYFPAEELDTRIRNAKAEKSAAQMTSSNVKRLLLESGILGVVRERKELGSGKVVIEAVFEYQIKDILPLKNDSIYAVHPMVYQDFQIALDVDSFVYPMPSLEEEEILFAIFKDDEC